MPDANVSWSLAAVIMTAVAGCSPSAPVYTKAIVARTASGPTLVVLDDSGIDFVSIIDVATGARTDRHPLGTQGTCLPSVPGRIWCGYTADTNQYEHEEWDLSTFEMLADNQAIAGKSPISFTQDQIQRNPSVVIRAADHALVLSNADPNVANANGWAVNPRTFAVSAFTQIDSSQVIPSLDSDQILEGLTSFSVSVGAHDYWVDSASSILQKMSPGSDSSVPLNPAQTFVGGAIVLLDGYNFGAGPIVVQGPESIFIVSQYSNNSDNVGSWVARVATADGHVVWRAELKEAQFVDVVVSAGGVLGLVERLTAWAHSGQVQAPVHARAMGLDLQSGASRWKLDI